MSFKLSTVGTKNCLVLVPFNYACALQAMKITRKACWYFFFFFLWLFQMVPPVTINCQNTAHNSLYLLIVEMPENLNYHLPSLLNLLYVTPIKKIGLSVFALPWNIIITTRWDAVLPYYQISRLIEVIRYWLHITWSCWKLIDIIALIK